jgi:hypothetical protein
LESDGVVAHGENGFDFVGYGLQTDAVATADELLEFEAVSGAGLFKGAGEVGFDGGQGDAELDGDFFLAEAGALEFDDLSFAWTQRAAEPGVGAVRR